MPYKFAQTASMFVLLDEIVTLATSNNWTMVNSSYNASGDLTGAVLQGIGDGNDKLYVSLSIHSEYSNKSLILDAAAGEDPYLEVWEQPGSIRQWNKIEAENDGTVNYRNKTIPTLSITTDESFAYFIFVNDYRIIVICRLSIDYQSAYLGFINPISSEKQFPYPMYIAGNSTTSHSEWPNNPTASFVFPTSGTGWLRRADGVWRAFEAPYSGNISVASNGALFPYDCNNTSLVPNYLEDNSVVDDTNFLLIPVLLHTNNPVDMNGVLHDVYWVSGTRDIAAEQIIVINSKQFMAFDAGRIRGSNSYFCVELV